MNTYENTENARGELSAEQLELVSAIRWLLSLRNAFEYKNTVSSTVVARLSSEASDMPSDNHSPDTSQSPTPGVVNTTRAGIRKLDQGRGVWREVYREVTYGQDGSESESVLQIRTRSNTQNGNEAELELSDTVDLLAPIHDQELIVQLRGELKPVEVEARKRIAYDLVD